MDAFQPQSEPPHRPLEPGEIRIVTLLPGRFDGPINCTLEHVKLSDLTLGSTAAAYQAVSYVWGDPTQTQPITLDGAAYPVTANLYSALKYLRETDTPARLWVDSVCINQQDVFERSAQVGRMRAIYASAAQVSVWLGDYGAHPKSDWHLGFQYMIARADWMAKPPTTPAEQRRFDTLEARHARGSEIMAGLLARPWFMRAWVVQEVAVRHFTNDDEKVKLMVGHLTVPWFAIDRAFGRLLYNRASLPDGTLSDSYGAPNGLSSIAKAWNYKHLLTLLAAEAKYVSFGEQLAIHLSRFTQFGATDQRDRIYSLLGMLVGNETVPDSLAPDYSKPASRVFHEYTAWMLLEGGCIDVLGLNSGPSQDGGPSWVPNFVGRRGVFYRNLEDTSPAKLLDGDRLLEIEALPLTVVSAAGPRCSIRAESAKKTAAGATTQEATEVFLEECRRYLSGCEDLLSVLPEAEGDSAGETEASPAGSRAKASKLARLKGWAKRASRVPEAAPAAAGGADTPTPRQRLNKYFEDSFATSLMDSHWSTPLPPKQLYDVLMTGPADDGPAQRVALSGPYGSYIADEFDGYTLFACENGDVDFCRSTSLAPQPGDMVCLLRGSTHRYLLRPVGGMEQWTLVGTAYMDAEFGRGWHRHGQKKEAEMKASYAKVWKESAERGNVVQVVIR